MAEEENQESSEENQDNQTAKKSQISEVLTSVPITFKVDLGATKMPISQLLKLGRGAVISFNTKVGEPLKAYADDKLFATCEIEVIDNKIGVSIIDIL